jgi:prephenate dehydrogenase
VRDESNSYRVGVIGLGLIGGSLALGLKRASFASRVTGYDIDPQVPPRAVEFGVIDDYAGSLAGLLERVDVVVISAPTLASERALREIFVELAQTPRDIWITDVASVKGPLCAVAEAVEGDLGGRFIPGHPIAGSERSGVGAADAGLFVGHRVVLTPTSCSMPAGVALVSLMWEALGAAVVQMSVEEHDRVLAATSHLPHVLAYTLVQALAQSEESSDIFRLAAGGFRDFTRIASSDPVMWRDISLANSAALVRWIDVYSERLGELRSFIDQGDGVALEQVFSDAKRARDDFAQSLPARPGRKAPKRN